MLCMQAGVICIHHKPWQMLKIAAKLQWEYFLRLRHSCVISISGYCGIWNMILTRANIGIFVVTFREKLVANCEEKRHRKAVPLGQNHSTHATPRALSHATHKHLAGDATQAL